MSGDYTREEVELLVTDEMVDAACEAVPDLYRVDAHLAIAAALTVMLNDPEYD